MKPVLCPNFLLRLLGTRDIFSRVDNWDLSFRLGE